MSVTKYEKNGKILWRVYVDLRGRRDSKIRVQKRINDIASEREAKSEEKRVLRELSEQINTLEAKGVRWIEVVERWARQQELYPTKRLALTTVQDYEALLKNWTKPWLEKCASELNRGDGREVFRHAEDAGRGARFRKGLKNTINMIYSWGIEERLINGVHHSPVYGLDVAPDRDEKRPEILTIEEIRALLRKAQEQKHAWYHVWVSAVLTGCRSGELHELRKTDLQIVSQAQAIAQDKLPFDKRRYGFICVRRGWNTRTRSAGPTKAGYWRNVPVSSEFYWFLIRERQVELLKPEEFLLPRFWEWDKGEQARIIRAFCIGNNIPSIKFHTLRACFATQLIASGIPATVVMKICGWKDLKTMQRYIRLAGIDEAGATESLHFIPTDEAVMERVVSMYDYKKRDE
jgi:integrase